MSRLSRLWRGSCTALAAALLAGCSSGEDDAVADAASRFYAAVADGDGGTACASMTPKTRSETEKSAGKPCPKAVLEEHVPAVTKPVRVTVRDTMAQVRYAEDTAFLTRIGDRWRVVAVSCTRQPGNRPYDCQVQGG